MKTKIFLNSKIVKYYLYIQKGIEAFNFHIPFENEIIVDQDSKIKTIQDAIDLAKPRTIIKIKSGVYFETLLIE